MESNVSSAASEALPFPPNRDTLYIVIPITIAYTAIFLSGVTGNIITCVVIARNKHMHTATNYYLFSLAVSDLLLLVTGLPQEMYSIWSKYPYVFGEVFCVLRGLAAETSANASVLTITAFTVERYVAICHPFFAHTLSKLSRAVRLILVIWAVALGFAIPQALQFGVTDGDRPQDIQCIVHELFFKYSFEMSTLLFFALPMTVITVLYALIALRLRRSALLKKTSGSFSHHQENRRACRTGSSRKVLKMLVAVVVAFFICWAPFHTQRLVWILWGMGQPSSPLVVYVYTAVTYLSGLLYYVSATINPILYHIMSLKFREAFKDSLSRCCCCRGRGRGSGGRGRHGHGVFGLQGQQRPLTLLGSKSVTDSGSGPSHSHSQSQSESTRSDHFVKRQVSFREQLHLLGREGGYVLQDMLSRHQPVQPEGGGRRGSAPGASPLHRPLDSHEDSGSTPLRLAVRVRVRQWAVVTWMSYPAGRPQKHMTNYCIYCLFNIFQIKKVLYSCINYIQS